MHVWLVKNSQMRRIINETTKYQQYHKHQNSQLAVRKWWQEPIVSHFFLERVNGIYVPSEYFPPHICEESGKTIYKTQDKDRRVTVMVRRKCNSQGEK